MTYRRRKLRRTRTLIEESLWRVSSISLVKGLITQSRMSRRQQQVLSVTAGSTRLMTILLVAALLLPAAILAAPPSLAAAGSLGK